MAVAMPAGLVSAPPALADPPHSHRPTVADEHRTVDGKNLKVKPRKADPAAKPGPAAQTAWPKAGTAEVTVPKATASTTASARAATAGPAARAGTLPVKVLPAATQSAARGAVEPAGKVRVSILDQALAAKTGLTGVAFTVARTDKTDAGQVGVQLDYSQFARAFGGAYGSRLRLFQMPACALSSPDKAQCRLVAPLETVNNADTRTLTAQVTAAPATTTQAGTGATAATPTASVRTASAGTLLVAAADSSGSQGDYKATSLEASATWHGGGSTGDFTWSYPMRVPPVPGGLTPNVAISYSSGSVDGKTANTNGQPSWVGEGFDLWPGYIERHYKPCEDDGAPKDEWGNSPADQCWGYDNATVTWNGKGGELIKASDGTWRMKGDDGTKFEKLTSSSTGNGDNDGEYWKVTTSDGTQYFFGLNRVPDWTSGKPETDSAWTVPVYGDDADDPCHKSSFGDSWCQQAYRWNLDYVVDPSGNAIIYSYGKETNYYGRNLKAADETPYTRGGYLKTISYGLRQGSLFAKAPAQVSFDTSERCIPDADFNCDPAKIGDKPDYWWDVPWDLHCDSGQECKDTHGTLAPTFWSRKRLTKVTTQILKPDASGYRPVDSWALDHSWGLADVERDLLLKEIQHTGHAADGSTATLPKVTFNHVQLPNRLDKTGDDILPYIRYRLGAIYDESGGQIDIAYSDPDCSLSDLPTPETNTTRCMPVIWTPPGREDPMTDWFHKYVVTSVIQTDRTGLAPDMATKYQYIGDAAWHFDDDDGLTKEKNKTWSQWRGYGQVRTLTGSFDDPSAQTDTFYLRGMNGDRKNKDGGEKTVTVSDGEGGSHTDDDAFSGFALKTVTYDKPGGTVYSKTVNTPWKTQTASRTRSWGTTTANVTATGSTQTWTVKDGGGWTQTKTANTYKTSGPGVGRVTVVDDLGDVTTADDDKCTRTSYADNTGAWMVNYPSRVETVAVSCSTTPDRSKQVVSDVRTYYDDGGLGAAPAAGNATKIEKIASHDGTNPTYVTQVQTRYDAYGRATQATDAAGHVATSSYTDPNGLTTQVTTTGPPATAGNASTALTTVQQIDPAWGSPVTKIDKSNYNLRTDLVYDPLGRLIKVWLPDESKASGDSPDYEYTYRVTDQKIAAVTTKTLTATGGQRLSQIQLLDGWLRPRQTQVPGSTGRLVSDTFYDERGQVIKTYAPYPADGAPDTELFGIGTPGDVETQVRTSYDGLGRKTVESTRTGNGSQPEMELWRTTYSYGGGNRVSATPPDGGTPTAQITDARGQVVERRQYKAATATGDYDATKYTYTPTGEIASVTDPSGNTFTTTYDLRGRKIKTTDPDKGTTTYTYNDLDQVTSTTDARGKKIFTDYDGQGRKTATHDGSADGPLLASYTYDTAAFGKGKLASTTRHTPDGDYTSKVRHYDQLGRADATSLIVPASQGPLAGTYLFGTTYNLDGTIQGQGFPAAGGLPAENTVFSYDDLQRPTKLTSNLATYIGATGYTKTNQLNMLEHGTGSTRAWQTFSYTWGTQRLETAKTFREGIDGNDRYATYHYADAGTITSITDTSHDGVDNQCFTYDHLQRLTDAWTQGSSDACASQPAASVIGGPAPYWQTFTYDTAGNRKTQTLHGIGSQTDTARTYTYADPGHGNRLNKMVQTGGQGDRTDTYGYDDTGNTTTRAIGSSPTNTGQTLDWDTEGELTKVTENGATTSYVYDADGNRLLRKDATGSTLYMPDGTELRALTGAATATGTRYYSFAGQTVAMRTSDGTVTYLTADTQGTAQVAINATTQQTTVRRTDPFGNTRGLDDDATWPSDKGFVGGTQEPTGLTTLGAREYDPQTGRFISVDPLMDQADPQQMNGYTYANNNPVTWSDPDGTMWGSPTGPAGCPDAGCYMDHDGNLSNWQDLLIPHYDPPVRHVWSPADLISTMAPGVGVRPTRPKFHNDDHWQNLAHGVSNFTGGLFVGFSETTPLGPLFMIPGAEGKFADLIGADDGSGSWKAGGYTWLLISLFGGGEGAAAKLGTKAEKGGWQFLLKRLLAGCRAPNSFVAGTRVLLAGGATKPIENIKVGDKVLATDPETGETAAEPVLATITTDGDKNFVQITVDTATPPRSWTTKDQPKNSGSLIRAHSGQNHGIVIATDHHPFWIAGGLNKWINAGDLKPGMWLRTSAGTYIQITATKHWTHQQRTHNLTIANLHTYYVGAGTASFLVHNGCNPETLGETIGESARQVPRGGGQLRHIAEQVSGHGLNQEDAALATEAAAKRAFGETGGILKAPNGNLVVLPSQIQVGAWFEVTASGKVVGMKGEIGLDKSADLNLRDLRYPER
ncbi:RHS repeat-associated core domain-containing protein [Actinomadura opuntiae]|uniref:RHS repeat-associated core domain-containing protein n=1 Tax=Actinomadura sp. OS1-43 TaxID=604315 RepID=UPI00255AC926|nr:RHS repeat-associated core domain-containing protein [Actinomadura sp. OS1-43]MDL4813143.1 RHS repeat-associated core domain-containing protein [Actinomadura sp. OS1-43]